jgi:uncharacterized protein (UPF0261 family)
MNKHSIALVGAFDTKGDEYAYLSARLRFHGVEVILIDIGVLGVPTLKADYPREAVAKEAGQDLRNLVEAGRDMAMQFMAAGARTLVGRLQTQGQVSGLVLIGGSNAGYVMSQLVSILPFGFPKLLVSTIVSGDTRPYVGGTDLAMIYPVEDIAGINSVSRSVIDRAAAAMAAMAQVPAVTGEATTAIGMSMFGVTTACVSAVAWHIRSLGWESHIFHATGTGGLSLESLIAGGKLAAVVDVTTTELADDLVGGVCTAGPDRLTAAARGGVPQVICPGALDMVNFGPMDTVPANFRNRKLFPHNPAVTLMRTNPDENAQLGAIMARKLNESSAPVEVLIPARGFSQISMPGEMFHDPSADSAFVTALQKHIRRDIPVHVHDTGINEPEFADFVFAALRRVLKLEGSKQ